ncbi:MAG: 5-formyltetrahydrofolate cyclo-ligase [Desulfobulbaceae bacterium]|nr:MAG: 5-formyltetrahydrofolate cyclo-ligase [Desulfobulbaceae bacterium]
MENDKSSRRRQLEQMALPVAGAGKLAETLRRQNIYRAAQTIFVSPAPLLQQVRINALLDGKVLLMPGPGLKDGFYRLQPYSLSFKELGHAVTFKGLASRATLLDQAALADLHVDLALTDCLAVDASGARLGHGTGFFDLAMAILAEMGAVGEEALFVALGWPEQLVADALKQDPWDVRMNFFCHQHGLQELAAGRQQPAVRWENLETRRIRKIELLWRLSQARFPA